MAQHYKYSIADINGLMPFEMDVFMTLIAQHLQKVEEEKRKWVTE